MSVLIHALCSRVFFLLLSVAGVVLCSFVFAASSALALTTSNTHTLVVDKSSSEYLSISDGSQTGLDITGDMTIEAWIKLNSDPSSEAYTVVGKYSSGSDRSYLFDVGDSDLMRLSGNFGGSISGATVSWNPATSTWYHVAVTYESSSGDVKFYVNGVQQGATQHLGTGIYNGTADFRIGSRNGDSGTYFDGQIDEVRVWATDRSAVQINAAMNMELTGSETDLKGYWQLDNDALDVTSNNNDLTPINTPTYSTSTPFADVRHHSLSLSGDSDFVSILDTDQTGLDITGNLTIESWIKLNTDPGSDIYTIAGKYSTADDRSYLFDVGDSDLLRLGGNFNGTVSGASVSWNPATSTWYHVAVTYDSGSGNVKFYVDGVQQGVTQSVASGGIYNGTSDFRIGGRTGTPHSVFDGQIDDVRVWSSVRSTNDIANNRLTELVGNESNLQGYWKFNGNVLDSTSNANHFYDPTFVAE